MQEPTATPTPKKSYSLTIFVTVVATLALVFLIEKAMAAWRSSAYVSDLRSSQAALAAQEQRTKRYQDYQQGVEDAHKRYLVILDQQEKASARFEKILSTWERQQQEYQVYLDSLKHH